MPTVNYVDIGLNCYINADKVLYVVPYEGNSALAKKIRLSASNQPEDAPEKLINLARGRTVRSLLYLTTDQYVLASLNPVTLTKRIRSGNAL